MTDIEKSFLNAWRVSAEIYARRVQVLGGRIANEDDSDDILGATLRSKRSAVLSGGFTPAVVGSSFVETWEERKARRAAEAAAAKAAEYPNPQHVPQNFTTTLISREAAIAAGQKRYYTGDKCSHGHIAERIVSTRTCVECHRGHQLTNKTARGRTARKLARAEGKTRYLSEQRCPKGHVSERLVSNGHCAVCHAEAVRRQRHKSERVH
jgi:hypothetical protein